MRRLLANQPLRRPFVVTVAIAGTLGGCGSGSTATEAGSVSHNPPASPSASATPIPSASATPSHNPPAVESCPGALPDNGAACFGAGTCSYPSADCPGDDTATCVSNAWQVVEVGCSHNPPAYVPDSGAPDGDASPAPPDARALDAGADCPATEPATGAPCTKVAETCTYASSECPGFSDTATCSEDGTWSVAAVACSHNPPPVDAGQDGA